MDKLLKIINDLILYSSDSELEVGIEFYNKKKAKRAFLGITIKNPDKDEFCFWVLSDLSMNNKERISK